MKAGSIYPELYDDLLKSKADDVRQMFSRFDMPDMDVFPSSKQHYRMRAEFRIWHEDKNIHYAMFDPVTKKPFFLTEFPVASIRINDLMPRLMDEIQRSDVLSARLFQMEFLTTTTDESLVTMIYHRQLDHQWESEAKALERLLGIHVIGRSRKQRRVVSQDFVTERFTIEGQDYSYRQYENGFTQPNAGVNAHMLSWVRRASAPQAVRKGDLLELYCGNGNFTCILSANFNRVLATEISRTSVSAALHNISANGIGNVDIVKISSEEFAEAMSGQRLFRRLAHLDLESYRFHTVFVDPPRAGLDSSTLEQVSRFDHIIYISCNPVTLHKNLQTLECTHKVTDFALFDQFPYTGHSECGVYMSRR